MSRTTLKSSLKGSLKGSRDIEYLALLRAQHRRNTTVLFTCNACKYTFPEHLLHPDEMEDELYRCPDCGKFAVRPATEDEVAWYQRAQEENAEEDEGQTP